MCLCLNWFMKHTIQVMLEGLLDRINLVLILDEGGYRNILMGVISH